MAKLNPKLQTPWLCLYEFPSHEDAKAFQALVAEQFGFPPTALRRKMTYETPQTIGQWRISARLREHFQGRSFDWQMAAEAAIRYQYTSSTARNWLSRATKMGVLTALGEGTYEFTRGDGACATCQPEPLQCPPA